MIDPYVMIMLGSLFGAVVGNVGVWLYWRRVEIKDQKKFEADMAAIRYEGIETITTEHWTQEEIDMHTEAKLRYGVGVKAVQSRIDFEAGAKWANEQASNKSQV